MEVRCGSCNKLFRIADDKITGKGIKFACTRCGGAVRITKEEFEQYTLSKTAVSALDTFEPKPKPAATPSPVQAGEKVPEAPVAGPKDVVHPAPSVPDVVLNEHAPPFEEPAPFHEQPRLAEAGTTPESQPVPVKGPESKPKTAPPKPEPRAAAEPKPEAARQAAPQPEPAVMPTPPKEPVRHAPPSAERTIRSAPPVPSRSRSLWPVFLAVLILIGGAGYGVFWYLGMDAQTPRGTETPRESSPSSIEGLRIATATGSLEPNGDLLITCVVENALDRERPVWYVVVDIMGTQGSLLTRIRSVNGKQLFTQKDYDVLAGRGVNIQELKAKNLQEQGVIIPPRGSVTFEMRYLQPQGGIASFNAALQPFDPLRLFREIAEEIK